MMRQICLCVLIPIHLFMASASLVQGYHWPLEADPAVTSTFCEYRPGHFHSGIDLKTRGRVGLKVYAVDDGWVWRVITSPWGCGRGVYLKLADGRYAVYFHLSDFAPPLKGLVEEEQERRGRYSIDLLLEPMEVPVTPGQVIGYSGASGTGGPHLHFELRDSENRPLNPFKNGFSVRDTIPPRILALSITPLDVESTVDGGHGHAVVPVVQSGSGRFRAERSVTTWGRVGIGLRLYDRANAAGNKLAVYRRELYVDDRLLFRSQYDMFPFRQTRQVDLDRDFSLMKAGQGRFLRLYTVVGNDLPFSVETGPEEAGRKKEEMSLPVRDWMSIPGWHDVRVVATDANGNEAEVTMDVLVDSPPRIADFEVRQQGNQLEFRARAEDSNDEIQLMQFDCSTDSGDNWIGAAVDSINSPPGCYEVMISDIEGESVICRAKALDTYGLWSSPKVCFIMDDRRDEGTEKPVFRCESHFYNACVELILTADRPVGSPPVVTLNPQGGDPLTLEVTRTDLHRFSAVCPFSSDVDGPAAIRVHDGDPGNPAGGVDIVFDVYPVTEEAGGNVVCPDGKASAHFLAGGVYSTLWARIEVDSLEASPVFPMRSDPYLFSPSDVSFHKGATIRLTHGLIEGQAQRVGIYRSTDKNRWIYVKSRNDSTSGTVSASVHSFGYFALIEDTLTPDIWNLRPREGSKIRENEVLLFARVKDTGSGIGREEDCLMELDGRRVISEYDPEEEWLKYRVKYPLSPGPHMLSVSVTDMAGNTTTKTSRFWIVE